MAPPRPSSAAVVTPDAIVERRLRAQGIDATAWRSPAEVVGGLVAMQAQDPAGARWAVAARLPEGAATEAAVQRAFDDGEILRTHVMRGTWQLVRPADLRWLLGLVRPRLVRGEARRHHELGLDAALLAKSRAALERALRDGAHRSRGELARALEEAKVPAAGPRLSHVLAHAELHAVLCSGAARGTHATYALVDLRAPDARPELPRDEALAELALRYFRSRGPATLADFAWWAGLDVADARAALAGARSKLVSERWDEATFWRAAASRARAAREPSPCARLLPAFDEYLVAYRDRRAVLDPEQVLRVNAGGGLLAPTVLVDGRVIGTWRRELGRRTVDVRLELFDRVSARAARAIDAAARRYGAFLGLEPRLAGLPARASAR